MADTGLGFNPQTLLLGLGAIGEGLGNRGAQQTQTSTLNDPLLLQMRNNALTSFQGLLNPASTQGLVANQLSNVNTAADQQRMQLEGELAARGITGPAAIAALQNLETQRFSNVTQTRNQGDLLQRELQEKSLANFGNFLNQAPRSGQTTTTSDKGNVAGGVVGGLANKLGFLLGEGFFGGGSGQGIPGLDMLGMIPGLAGGNTPLAAAGTAGATSAGTGAGSAITGGLATAGKSIGTLGGLLPLSAGIPILGGIAAASYLLPKAIGRGREQADVLTGEGGMQNIFDKQILPAIVDNPTLDQATKNQLIQQAYKNLQVTSQSFAAEGDQQRKVVDQMLASYRTNPVTASALAGLGA